MTNTAQPVAMNSSKFIHLSDARLHAFSADMWKSVKTAWRALQYLRMSSLLCFLQTTNNVETRKCGDLRIPVGDIS